MIALQICLASFIFACGTYLVWPSRWNIHAHTQLGFWFVSAVVPIYFVHVLRGSPELGEYAHLMVQGAVWFTLFMVVGALVRSRGKRLNLLERVALVSYLADDSATRRTKLALWGGVLLLGYAIVRMGFIPMFAADPLLAKFFRGPYAAPYAPVAIYFRFGMSLLSLLIPAAAAYALTSTKRGPWRLVLIVSLGLMIVTLQRGPAVSGLITFLGVWLVRKRKLALFIALSIATYVGGTMFYALLTKLGILAAANATGDTHFWSTVASTAPDISDALGFLGTWHHVGEPLTHGRTFLGGIVPSHYKWNPAVWTLTLENSTTDVNSIGSGGIRLPVPIWGLVAFGGSASVAAISAASGFFSGWLARAARDGMETAETLMTQVWVTMLYLAVIPLLPTFYAVNYVAVVQFAALYLILRPGLSALPEGVRLRDTRRSGGAVSQSSIPSPATGRPHRGTARSAGSARKPARNPSMRRRAW